MAAMGMGALLEEQAATSEVGPGLVAFTIVVLLAVATFLLVRSMLHHIGKVPPSFDDEPDAPDRSDAAGS
jgi:hypothetical protein